MSSFLDLDFISPDSEWAPKLTGKEKADYDYGYECAYRYSEALIRALSVGASEQLMKDNGVFRQSIDLHTSAGQGFQDGITGKPNRYEHPSCSANDV